MIRLIEPTQTEGYYTVQDDIDVDGDSGQFLTVHEIEARRKPCFVVISSVEEISSPEYIVSVMYTPLETSSVTGYAILRDAKPILNTVQRSPHSEGIWLPAGNKIPHVESWVQSRKIGENTRPTEAHLLSTVTL